MKRLILTLISLFSIFCASFSQNLYKIEKNGLFGYANDQKKTVIKCKYKHAYTDTINTIGFVYDQKTKKIKCFNNKGKDLFNVFFYDNGPDYVNEGLFRITNRKGLIGFADIQGNIIIKPQYLYAYPFKNGKAKVTLTGEKITNKEQSYWKSKNWFFIKNPLSN